MRVIDEQVCTDRSQSPVGCVEKGVGGQVVLWTYLLAFQHAPQVSAMFRCGEYGGVNEKYHYDNLGQLTRHSQTISGQPEWTFEYTYNQLGRQSSITYPSGKKIKYRYNNKGFMDCVIDAALGNVIWQANASDRWVLPCFSEKTLYLPLKKNIAMKATAIEGDCKSPYSAPANCKFAGTGTYKATQAIYYETQSFLNACVFIKYKFIP